MKWLGRLFICLVCGGSVFVGLSQRHGRGLPSIQDFMGSGNSNVSNASWDEINRQKVDSVFFVETADWMGDPGTGTSHQTADTSAEPVSSGMQTNPFFE